MWKIWKKEKRILISNTWENLDILNSPIKFTGVWISNELGGEIFFYCYINAKLFLFHLISLRIFRSLPLILAYKTSSNILKKRSISLQCYMSWTKCCCEFIIYLTSDNNELYKCISIYKGNDKWSNIKYHNRKSTQYMTKKWTKNFFS